MNVNLLVAAQIKKSKLTQEQIAAVVGIPRTAIAMIISGKRDVTANELLTFCKLFSIAPNKLMKWNEESENEKAKI